MDPALPAGPAVAVGGAGGPPAAAPPAPVPPGITGHPIASGQEHYDDASRDDWVGRYQAAPAVPSPMGALPPLQKREALTNAPETTAAFPILLQRVDPLGPARWFAVTGCFRYRPPAGAPPSPHDGGHFGLLGDVRGARNNQLPQVVALPANLFARVAGVNNFRLPEPDNAVALYAAAAQGDLLGPFAADAANTRLVPLANTAIVPHCYGRFFFGEGVNGVTPKAGVTDIVSQIISDGRVGACEDLANALIGGATKLADGDLASPLAIATTTLVAPTLDTARLHEHAYRVLKQRCPGFDTPVGFTEGGLVARAIGEFGANLDEHRRQDREDNAERQRKTVTKKLGETRVGLLLRLCQAEWEDQLPSVCHQLARSSDKDSDRFVIQQEADDTADTLGHHDLDIGQVGSVEGGIFWPSKCPFSTKPEPQTICLHDANGKILTQCELCSQSVGMTHAGTLSS